ncbi:fasciclin domain-containing protein [Pelagibacterium halotolerans]|uniref:Secreted and surface protein containing fasciclin-like repeats n=1 Tax=Pelagibacterium halotolerans (strain DSM 22347 / JCM 15775 / CGMCC 1.7692 / B2) TaxID=1082931 RepID=G4R6E1_PELHB|nr:fasciclin domain-containing protein [Pelagibacterium halotolerans]AEQ53206.1 Secreted and surface protein containing fasciclin-like repeats [Pelagibacterium halotolerans B2]SEA90035.1 Uncaracterized surface protein containing fasciclin (FAS1) repeats [Pelagibacterium halotolerans]
MLKFVSALALGVAVSFGASSAIFAQDNPMVGGAPMSPEMNIIENAVNSADHTTLVAAVQAAGLVDTLQGPGPFTVFAPTNAAFGALPAGTVDTLLEPQNLEMLQKVLTAHVLAGDYSAADLVALVEANGGAVGLATVSGDTLGFQMIGGSLIVVDENRNAARVTIADVNQSNGVIHVVDSVLVPN